MTSRINAQLATAMR